MLCCFICIQAFIQRSKGTINFSVVYQAPNRWNYPSNNIKNCLNARRWLSSELFICPSDNKTEEVNLSACICGAFGGADLPWGRYKKQHFNNTQLWWWSLGFNFTQMTTALNCGFLPTLKDWVKSEAQTIYLTCCRKKMQNHRVRLCDVYYFAVLKRGLIQRKQSHFMQF